MKDLKLGSDFGSGIFQGNLLRIIHMKMIATDQTSVFLGSYEPLASTSGAR